MRIRFYGGRVLSGRPLQPQNAEVWVENDRISYVGPARPDAPAFDREIDGKVYIDDAMKGKMEAYLEKYGAKG